MDFTYNLPPATCRLQTPARAPTMPGLNYSEEDELSSSSYNFQASNTSTITFEPPSQPSPAATWPKKHVRKMIELFDSKSKPSTTSVVSLAGSVRQTRGGNAVHRSSINANATEHVKPTNAVVAASAAAAAGCAAVNAQSANNDRCGRCNTVKRCECSNIAQYAAAAAQSSHFRNDNESNSTKNLNYAAATGCYASFHDGHANNNQWSTAMDANDQRNVIQPAFGHTTEISQNVKILPKTTLYNTKTIISRAPNGELENSNFHDGHTTNNQWSSFIEANEQRNVIQPSFANTTEISQNVNILPETTMYNSKTIISRTPNGIRIVVDIDMFEQHSANANLGSSRVETDIKQSQILDSFQRDTMMSLGTTYALN